MDHTRIDRVIQFALLVASRAEDYRDRELGPIHLIKYVYLADLAYASHHAGETYTRARWRFYKFGPWSQDVYERLSPAVAMIHGDTRTFEWSNDSEDGQAVRYSAVDNGLYESLENELDFRVVSAIKTAVRAFYGATPELLHHVYLTRPMLRAAPNEPLDFTPEPRTVGTTAPASPPTVKQLKRQRKIATEARARFEQKLAAKQANRKGRSFLTPTPRYDEVYEKGMRWLDSLAGDDLPEQGDLVFGDDIWKSRSRFDPDLS